jgi:lipid A 3-O-deacylase
MAAKCKRNDLCRYILTLLIIAVMFRCGISYGEEAIATDEGRERDRYGLALEGANTYDPGHDISFFLVSVFALYDYGKVWHSEHPKEQCFKVEASVGASTRPHVRTVASAEMLALRFLDFMSTTQARPFFEAGIGIIYTDFRVPGQGLRVNFNPKLGFGAEFPQKSGSNLFMSLRLHHLSNGNLYHENRGMNSIGVQVGSFF